MLMVVIKKIKYEKISGKNKQTEERRKHIKKMIDNENLVRIEQRDAKC